MSAVLQTPRKDGAAERSPKGPARTSSGPTLGWLAAILAAQVGLALRPRLNKTAFDDEGLYIYFGHLSVEHLLHGVPVPGAPGSYFSGAPWLYPTLAALGASIDGLAGARDVSLLFSLIATVATFGLGRRLFGSRAGLIGAAAFVANGSVMMLSHFATYDSMAMCCIALAAWLTVYVAQSGRSRFLPAIVLLLTVAFFTKYAVAVYVPAVALLGLTVGWRVNRRKAVTYSAVIVAATAGLTYALTEVWFRDLIVGIRFTTTSRVPIIPASAGSMTRQIAAWVGVWLALAVLAAALRPREWPRSAVLLVASVIGPIDQLRIGESLSLNKHVAFGLVFASPLVGDLLARATRRVPRVGAVAVAATLAALASIGLHYSTQFLTGWPDDHLLTPILSRAVAATPGRPILAEEPAPQQYLLDNVTTPAQWYNTYYLGFDGKVGMPAYIAAIGSNFFGVIYLDSTTTYGVTIQDYLWTHRTPYHLAGTAVRYFHGRPGTGRWFVYTSTTTGSSAAAVHG